MESSLLPLKSDPWSPADCGGSGVVGGSGAQASGYCVAFILTSWKSPETNSPTTCQGREAKVDLLP